MHPFRSDRGLSKDYSGPEVGFEEIMKSISQKSYG
jgi:hypothetical protein